MPVPAEADGRIDVLLHIMRHVRTDTFAVRWESQDHSRSGYKPAANYEWRTDGGGKRKNERVGDLFRLEPPVLQQHLHGALTAGVYFVQQDGTVRAAGIDVDAHLDKSTSKLSRNWPEVWDVCCRIGAQLSARGVHVTWFRSRSGNGANGWVFWDRRQLASTVRSVVTQAVESAMGRKSAAGDVEVYPKQDAISTDGFGNLMCLPFAGRGALLDEHGIDTPVPAGWTPALSDDLTTVVGGGSTALVGGGPAAALANVPIDMNAAAQNGLVGRHPWFPELDVAAKNIVVKTCLDAIDNTASDPYDGWRDLGFACLDAKAQGADRATEHFREWSRRGAGYSDDAAVNGLLDSNKSHTGKRIGVGTLLAKGVEAGADLSRYRDAVQATTAHASINARTGIISALPTTMRPDQAMELVNQMFFFAHDWGGEPVIGHVTQEGVRAITEQQLRMMLANRYVEVPVADNAGKVTGTERVPLGRWWLAHPQRREYDRVIYDPEQMRSRPGERVFNLWTGFAKTPRPGSWNKLARHIHDVVCKRDRRAWRYLIRWLAHAVQRPGTAPGTVPVLKSDAEGTGKSSLLEWMARMFGEHALMLSTPEDLIGQFNDHLESKSLIGLNEPAFPGDHRAAGKLKSMITEATWLINGKFRAARRIPNIAHLLLTTNASWAVPAGNQARRFFVLDVDERRAGDRAYFNALWAEADGGGIDAMLYALLRVNLTDFNSVEMPKTQALRQQQVRSAPTMTQWAVDAATARILVPPPAGVAGSYRSGFNTKLPSASLYDAYKIWVANMKQRPVSNVEFGRWLTRCGFPRTMVHGTPSYDIPDPTVFAAAVLRQAGII